MNAKYSHKEKGQSLVLIAVLIVFFFGILGLALDGGNAYAMKRAAQNAADSGALASAAVLCNPNDTRIPHDVADSYVQQNKAVMVNFTTGDKVVTVTASIVFDTFFLNFFGRSQMTASAIASAGCFSPGFADGVLPVAWSCRPPTLATDVPPPDPTQPCEPDSISESLAKQYAEQNPQTVHPKLYIIMDNFTYTAQTNPNTPNPQDFYCKEDYPGYGTMTCDLDGDGKSDFFGGAGRSWLDLDGQHSIAGNPNCDPTGTEGSNELAYWIRYGFRCTLGIHTWLGEQTGDVTSLYKATEDRRKTNPKVVLPVYDKFCPGADPQVDCPNLWDAGKDKVYWVQPMYFHIIGFSYFYITCVNQGNIKIDPTSRDLSACPGIEEWAEKNAALYGWNQNVNINSIEGYFLDEVPPGLGGRPGEGVDTGVYTIYLIR